MAPLEGFRVLDLSRLLPGPLCTRHLADLGADVIKLEAPGTGDYLRSQPPLQNGVSVLFLQLNRNKRSLALDLRHPAGQAVLHRLVKTADVFLETFRPGVAEKLGAGYATLSALRPGLIYCSLTGYGQNGPLAHTAGHDLNFQALSGALDQTGSAAAPAQGNFQPADLLGGTMNAAFAILTALFHRERTGQGTYLDIAMLDGLLAHQNVTLASTNAFGQPLPRGTDGLAGGLACYCIYQTADERWAALGALEPKFWANFCAAVERPDWVARQFSLGSEGEALKAEVQALFAQQPLAHWQARLEPADCCFSPVLRLDEALQHPQVQARGMVRHVVHPSAGTTRQFEPPFRFGAEPGGTGRAAPGLGEQTREILTEVGYEAAEIDNLLAQGTLQAFDE